MKSIRQKAKDYDKALEIARPYYKEAIKSEKTASIEFLESMFDELRDNDEKIRKELIRAFNSLNTIKVWNGIERTDILAWLEKQGQKPTTIDIDKMVRDYANNKERGNEEFGKPVLCMVRAYRQGLNDAIGKVVLAPTWSEEDEKTLNEIFSVAARASLRKSTLFGKSYDYIKWQNWLKTIKQRIEGE